MKDRARVFIATTNGPVEVVSLIDEDKRVGRSFVCIAGTTSTADFDRDYQAFVARGTGVIERLYGHGCFRLDVSSRIDDGFSWQMGVFIAHALYSAGRLAQERDTNDVLIWATGLVRPLDLTVTAVHYVEEKLSSSFDVLKQGANAGQRLSCSFQETTSLTSIQKLGRHCKASVRTYVGSTKWRKR